MLGTQYGPVGTRYL